MDELGRGRERERPETNHVRDGHEFRPAQVPDVEPVASGLERDREGHSEGDGERENGGRGRSESIVSEDLRGGERRGEAGDE